MDTRFYSGNKHDIDALKFFRKFGYGGGVRYLLSCSSIDKTAYSPTVIASCFFKSVGRSVVHEQGYFSVMLAFLLKLIDINFLGNILWRTAT